MSDFFNELLGHWPFTSPEPVATPKLSTRTLQHAIEQALIDGYTRDDLELVMTEELGLGWPHSGHPSSSDTKRELIGGYMTGWGLPQMAALGRKMATDLDLSERILGNLPQLLASYDAGGGVSGPTKNLIFAATGPKPRIVLKDQLTPSAATRRDCLHLPVCPANGAYGKEKAHLRALTV